MDEKRQEYLSDAELDELIRRVEEREMLQAPSYLKDEILFRIRELPAVSPEEYAEKFSKGRTEERTERKSEQKEALSPERRKRMLFFYSLKVSLAAAAAIVLLFVFPVREQTGAAGGYWRAEEEYIPPSSRAMRLLNEHSTQFCRRLSYVSNWLVSDN